MDVPASPVRMLSGTLDLVATLSGLIVVCSVGIVLLLGVAAKDRAHEASATAPPAAPSIRSAIIPPDSYAIYLVENGDQAELATMIDERAAGTLSDSGRPLAGHRYRALLAGSAEDLAQAQRTLFEIVGTAGGRATFEIIDLRGR